MTNEVSANATVNNNKKTKRKKIASLDKRKAVAGWLFVLPFLLGFVLIYLPMVFDSIKISFTLVGKAAANGAKYGWTNYYDAFFTDVEFVQKLVLGLETMAFNIPAILVFSLFMAVLLNQKMAGRAVFRAILFVPVIISTGIMETVAASNLQYEALEQSEHSGIDTGAGKSAQDGLISLLEVEKLFAMMKVGHKLALYVTRMVNNIFDLVNLSGVQMLIFLAALQSISPAIYESCRIDGATAWETFWKITFPMISPMILVNAVYTVIDSFTTNSNVVMTYVQQVYSVRNEHEVSTAMSWIYFMMIVLIVGIIAAICSAFVFYQRRE